MTYRLSDREPVAEVAVVAVVVVVMDT